MLKCNLLASTVVGCKGVECSGMKGNELLIMNPPQSLSIPRLVRKVDKPTGRFTVPIL